MLQTAHDSPTPVTSTTNLPAVERARLRRVTFPTVPHGRAHTACFRSIRDCPHTCFLLDLPLLLLLLSWSACSHAARLKPPPTHGGSTHSYDCAVGPSLLPSKSLLPLHTAGVPTVILPHYDLAAAATLKVRRLHGSVSWILSC